MPGAREIVRTQAAPVPTVPISRAVKAGGYGSGTSAGRDVKRRRTMTLLVRKR